MNFSDYIIVPLELIIWVLCSLIKKLFKKKNVDTSYIPYIAMLLGVTLAIAMKCTSDMIGGSNIWEVIVIGIANGAVAVGINEAGKTVTTSSGEQAIVMNKDVDDIYEEVIDEPEKDAEEEIVENYDESDVAEINENVSVKEDAKQ